MLYIQVKFNPKYKAYFDTFVLVKWITANCYQALNFIS